MTRRLDPIEKAQRAEARHMVAYTTGRHAEHADPGAFEKMWCRHCRRADLEDRIARMDAILEAAR